MITLPVNQSRFGVGVPPCQVISASGNSSCNLLTNTLNSITMSFANQTQIVIGNIINLQPNSNLLEIDLLTNNMEMIENSTKAVTPPVQYNAITISALSSTMLVGTNAILQLNITAAVSIDLNSQIVISFPNATYTRISSIITGGTACSYGILGVNYTSCVFSTDGGWLTQVNLTYLGPLIIPVNSLINLSIPLTNSWAAYPFNYNAISIYLSNPLGFYIGKGSISMGNISPGMTSFQPVAISSSLSITQSSQLANS